MKKIFIPLLLLFSLNLKAEEIISNKIYQTICFRPNVTLSLDKDSKIITINIENKLSEPISIANALGTYNGLFNIFYYLKDDDNNSDVIAIKDYGFIIRQSDAQYEIPFKDMISIPPNTTITQRYLFNDIFPTYKFREPKKNLKNFSIKFLYSLYQEPSLHRLNCETQWLTYHDNKIFE